jgi:hypothetical protein
VFSADIANEEWEVEISPSSRYDTEGKLALNSRSTPLKSGASARAFDFGPVS